jgi:hypothetical protein
MRSDYSRKKNFGVGIQICIGVYLQSKVKTQAPWHISVIPELGVETGSDPVSKTKQG